MRRALLLLLALSASAQESAVLGGWALPEGTVVQSTMSLETVGTLSEGGVAVAFEEGFVEVHETRLDVVEDGRLMRAVQRLRSSSSKVRFDGVPAPTHPDPLLGRAVSIERVDNGWVQRAAGWLPTSEQQAALDESISLDDSEYPVHAIRVGETVEVDQETIRETYVDVAPGEHLLTVRLDSLGTVDGAPVAYITQEVGVTLLFDGGTMRMDMTARIVRRLDWMIDAETEWSGPIRYAFDDGVSMEGTMRYSGAQTVRLPADP